VTYPQEFLELFEIALEKGIRKGNDFAHCCLIFSTPKMRENALRQHRGNNINRNYWLQSKQ